MNSFFKNPRLFFLLIFLVGLGGIFSLHAQTGIGTNTPNANTALHIHSTNKGILIPSISLTSSGTFLNGSATASDNSLLVYNTNASTSGNGLSGPGFYYWEGGVGGSWNKVNSGTGLVDADNDTQIQVEETTDDDTIRFDTAGIERLIITDAGNVGIGTSTSGHKLKVSGSGAAVFLVDKGTEGSFGDGHGSTFNINQGDGTSSGGQRAFTVHGNPTSTIGLVNFYSHNGTGYVLGFHQDNFGNVSIGKEDPLTQLDITGDLRTDTFSTDWISGGTYATSDVVVYDGALYRNLLGANTTTVPNLDVTNWRNLDTPFASVTDELLFDDGNATGYLYVSLVINNAWQVTRFKKDDANDEGVANIGNNSGTTAQPTTLALCQPLTYD